MTIDFSSVHNHYERPVCDAVTRMSPSYPYLDAEILPDVACVALNRLGARYIRHTVDLAFYLTEKERLSMEQTITEAVSFAFEFVQARVAMRARR
jgi:Late competence development protein ComFB